MKATVSSLPTSWIRFADRTARTLVTLLMLVSLSVAFGCSEIPKDAAGTVERIQRSGEFHVTVVSGTEEPAPGMAVIRQLARDWSAKIDISHKPSSLALRDLEASKTDIVIGEFGRKGPEAQEASLSKAIGIPEPKDGKIPVLRFARKKGENRLIHVTDLMVIE